jgi:hypothetical protein
MHNWGSHLLGNYMLAQDNLYEAFFLSDRNMQIDEVNVIPRNLVKVFISKLTAQEKTGVLAGQDTTYRITGKLQPWINETGNIIPRFFDLSALEKNLLTLFPQFPAIQMLPWNRDKANPALFSSLTKGCDYGGAILFFEDGIFELIGFSRFYLIKDCIHKLILCATLCDMEAKRISPAICNSSVALLHREINIKEYYAHMLRIAK